MEKKICIYENINVIEVTGGFLFNNIITNESYYLPQIEGITVSILNSKFLIIVLNKITKRNQRNKKYKYYVMLMVDKLQKVMQDLLIGLYFVCLTMFGMGYRYRKFKNNLFFKLGLSHEIKIIIPETIFINVINFRTFEVYGSNYKKFKDFIIYVKNCKLPDIYKGKGILYENEKLILKKGKKLY